MATNYFTTVKTKLLIKYGMYGCHEKLIYTLINNNRHEIPVHGASVPQ